MTDNTSDTALTRAAIEATDKLIDGHIRRTPVIEVAGEDFGLPGVTLVLKLEYLQHAGSFKARGAFNHLLTRVVPAAGIVAASGGNHGAATAFAAMRTGVRATIFVPSVASPAKVEQIRQYGADLRIEGDRYDDALRASEAFAAQTGALRVHAYDQVETLLGQGTAAREFEQQAGPLDAVLVAVGGGGLIAGIGLALDGRAKVVGVEPEGSCCLARSLAAGHPVDVEVDSIAADSLGARNCGPRVFEAARRTVASMVLVPDAAIVEAQRLLWRDLRAAVEPGGATALAALLAGAYRPASDERMGVLVCGANVGLASLPA